MKGLVDHDRRDHRKPEGQAVPKTEMTVKGFTGSLKSKRGLVWMDFRRHSGDCVCVRP